MFLRTALMVGLLLAGSTAWARTAQESSLDKVNEAQRPIVIGLPFSPALGRSMHFEFEHRREGPPADSEPDRAQDMRQMVALTPLEKIQDGYVYNWRLESVHLLDPKAAAWAHDVAALGVDVDLKYRADKNGTPLELINWPEAQAAYLAHIDALRQGAVIALAKAGNVDGAKQLDHMLAETAETYKALDAAGASALLLREAEMLFQATGGQYYRDYAAEYQVDIPFDMARTTILGTMTRQMIDYAPDKDRAVIKIEMTHDRASVEKAVGELIGRLSAADKSGLPDDARQALAALKTFDLRDDTSIVIDLRDGHQIDTRYVRTIKVGDARRTDRYRIRRLSHQALAD